MCQGTTFQVCVLLEDTSYNPTSDVVLRAFETGWSSWAGFPEYGVFTDRAKYFITEFAEALSAEGCFFDSAARAAPWQLGQIERHGAIWKSIIKKLVWSSQLAGKDQMTYATAAANQAKNSLIRKSGFSPYQWVLGKSIRLPTDLTDESEICRLGAIAQSMDEGSKYFLKTKLRFQAREAFVQVANSEALKRAELRKLRPARGPFDIGRYVFYFDASDQTPGPGCWRGVARVIGKEGSHTVWISHRGIILAVSPEHLAFAEDHEVRQWSVVGSEMELLDAQPAAGGTTFIDLRKQPLPPDAGFPELEDEKMEKELEDQHDNKSLEYEPSIAAEEPTEANVLPEQPPPVEDLSSDSLSMARMKYESDREQKRSLKSFEFFEQKRQRRLEKQEERRERFRAFERSQQQELPPEEIPVPKSDYDPDVDDYHQSQPSKRMPAITEDPEAEAQERESKRLRMLSSSAPSAPSDAPESSMFCYLVVEEPGRLMLEARRSYFSHEEFYKEHGIDLDVFEFGFRRNVFEDRYNAMYDYAMGATPGTASGKKKGRKEILLKDLHDEHRQLFTGPGGSDEKEWSAWKEKEAVDILSPEESEKVRRKSPDLIIPTRWVRTNKADGLEEGKMIAKSRLVVQGFKDRSLGYYRRDAPTASALAESICLAVSAYMGFTLISKDVRNAYFSGKSLDRDIYLEQPRGGLGALKPGQLLKARKAIYGFSEAARLFWIALKGHLESDGWMQSRLEPALFFLRKDSQLLGILVTHVDDLEGGVRHDQIQQAFQKSSKALEFATNHVKEFVFRGREVKQNESGHIDVSMRSYSLNTKPIKIDKVRRKQLESSLTEEEFQTFQSGAGELGWLTRQLRCDLCYENGVIQRAKGDACVADLVKLKQCLAQAKRSADFRLRYWADVDLRNGVLVHLADSGHANGTPEKDQIMRYRSVGGYFLMIANPEILQDGYVRANILSFHSGQTKRVCRSTLAAEASHLAEAVEAGDWCACLLEEALSGDLNLKDWPAIIQRRRRVYVTDAKSVFDYLHKDATSTSTDKRMAIEGALLRETVRQPNAEVRWIDGQQNISNVLTKANAEKETLKEFLKEGRTTLVQSELNKEVKEKKRMQRQKRVIAKVQPKKDAERRQKMAAEVKKDEDSESASSQQKKNDECEISP